MPRIKIGDIPQDQKISKQEMKQMMGGVEPTTFPIITTSSLKTGSLTQKTTDINFTIVNPIQYYPGHFW